MEQTTMTLCLIDFLIVFNFNGLHCGLRKIRKKREEKILRWKNERGIVVQWSGIIY